MSSEHFLRNLIMLFRIRLKDDENKSSFLKIFNEEIKIIETDKVMKLFNDIEKVSEEELKIYYHNSKNQKVVETAVDLYQHNRFVDYNINRKIEDSNNNIVYETNKEVSDYYIIWLYKKMFEKYIFETRTETTRRIQMIFTNRGTRRLRRNTENIREISLIEIMKNAIDCTTLKITLLEDSKVDIDEAVNSFSYTYMCNMNHPIKIYNLEGVLGINTKTKTQKNVEFDAPKRKYNSNLIDYYNLAASSEDPFTSYISYYHIIEYYFDEVYREQQINTLRESITSPRFSYKDDSQLFSIINKIIKDNRVVRENGSGNEHQSLNYVLQKYINDLGDFQRRLTEDELRFYQSKSVTFSKGDLIVWDNDKDKVLKSISNRIYKTRNSLIHSKSTKKDMTYHPYSHKKDLEKEISLIKAIAESVIENSSSYLI